MSSLPSHDSSKPPVTLYDIAEKVGVSYVTVSLALRNHPRISKARCEEVQRVAQEMGYRPNAMAAALASRKWDMARKDTGAVIAWLNLWPEPKRLRTHQEFDGYWRGAERAANKFGYRLEEFVVNAEMPLQRVEKILWNRSINGILIPPHPLLPDWGNFNWDRFSVVRFGNSITAPLVHSVTSDQAANAILAFHKMQERGYQRIGFASTGGTGRLLMFKAGFLSAQSELEEKLRIPPIVFEQGKTAENRDLLLKWLKKYKPDAILTFAPEMRQFLQELNYRIPEDIGLAALSILDGNADAGIHQNPEEIGRVAVLVAISLIHDASRGIPDVFRQVLISGRWVDGTTLPDRMAV